MAKQLWHTNEFNTELKDVPLLNTGECTIKSMFSFISAGTESLVISRSIPLAAHDFMKVPFMEGSFNLPCTYGYSLVGTIVSAQPSYPINSLVYLMHPHQDSIAVPAQSLTLIQSLPPKRATLIANMETALNACWDGQIQHGSKVLIAGYGIIGALVARVLKAEFNCNVSVAEINESRIDLLKQHGYDLDVNSIATYDIVFNTAANEKALQCCIEKLNKNGTLIELSWYGNKSVQLDLGAHFHFNRIHFG